MVGAFIAGFVRSLHADELDIRNGENGDEARAHGGDLSPTSWRGGTSEHVLTPSEVGRMPL